MSVILRNVIENNCDGCKCIVELDGGLVRGFLVGFGLKVGLFELV